MEKSRMSALIPTGSVECGIKIWSRFWSRFGHGFGHGSESDAITLHHHVEEPNLC
jgi:hypothetical protein